MMWKFIVLALVVNFFMASGRVAKSHEDNEDTSESDDDQPENNDDQPESDDDQPENNDYQPESDDDQPENDCATNSTCVTVSCGGDANATSGCDESCTKLCPYDPYLSATHCSCPENSCQCKDGYRYNIYTKQCVLLEDCEICRSHQNAEEGCDSKCERMCPNPSTYYNTLEKCVCRQNSCQCKEGYYFDYYKFLCVLPSQCTYVKTEDDNGNEQTENTSTESSTNESDAGDASDHGECDDDCEETSSCEEEGDADNNDNGESKNDGEESSQSGEDSDSDNDDSEECQHDCEGSSPSDEDSDSDSDDNEECTNDCEESSSSEEVDGDSDSEECTTDCEGSSSSEEDSTSDEDDDDEKCGNDSEECASCEEDNSTALTTTETTSEMTEDCSDDGGSAESCREDFNATIGCDETGSKLCPYNYFRPIKCSCPKDSCMCKDGYYYDMFKGHCVLGEDCNSMGLHVAVSIAISFGTSSGGKDCSSYPNAESGCDSNCEGLCPNPNSYYDKFEQCHCPMGSCKCKHGYKLDIYKFSCVLPDMCTNIATDATATTTENTTDNNRVTMIDMTQEMTTSGPVEHISPTEASQETTVSATNSDNDGDDHSSKGITTVTEALTPHPDNETNCCENGIDCNNENNTKTENCNCEDISNTAESETTADVTISTENTGHTNEEKSTTVLDNISTTTMETTAVTEDMTDTIESMTTISHTSSEDTTTTRQDIMTPTEEIITTTIGDTKSTEKATTQSDTMTSNDIKSTIEDTPPTTTKEISTTEKVTVTPLNETDCSNDGGDVGDCSNKNNTAMTDSTTTPINEVTSGSNETTTTCDDDCSDCSTENVTISEEITTESGIETTLEDITKTDILTTTTVETTTADDVITTTESPECPEAMSKLERILAEDITPKLLHIMVKSKPQTTAVMSALSLLNLYGLFKLYAHGETNVQLSKTFLGMSNDEIKCGFSSMNNFGKYLPSGAISENGKVIAVKGNFTFNDNFMEMLHKVIQCESMYVSDEDKGADIINELVRSQTGGTVTDVMSAEYLRNHTSQTLFATSGVHSQVSMGIGSGNIITKDFLVGPFNITRRPYLCQVITLNFTESTALKSQVVEVAHKGGSFLMFLPYGRLRAEDVIKTLLNKPELYYKTIEALKPQMVDICVPLFNVSTFFHLTDITEETDIGTRLLDTDTADLSGMVSPETPMAVAGTQRCQLELIAEDEEPSNTTLQMPVEKIYKAYFDHPFFGMTLINGLINQVVYVAG